MTQRITQHPDPVKPGERVTFCLDIEGLTLPVTLSGTWHPTGSGTFTHTVTSANDRCWDEGCPDNGQGGIIVDDSGNNPDFAIAVSP